MKYVCVFCGSSEGAHPAYAEAARGLGAGLVRRGLGLVYGGGSVGLMGIVADAVLDLGGEVIGVIPRGLATREFAHLGLTQLHVVESMHERKALMASFADGFVALPGGLGTLEELLEALTWSQLGIHRKPVGLLNVAGYWDPLLRMLAHAARERFMPPESAQLLLAATAPEELMDRVVAWRPPAAARVWLDQSQI